MVSEVENNKVSTTGSPVAAGAGGSGGAALVGRKTSKVRWMLGWILLPGSFLGGIFLGGVHVGARYPDMWLSEFLHWIFA